MAHALRIGNRPLQSLHAAQAAADNRRPLFDAEIVGKRGLGFYPVLHRNYRKIRAVFPARFRIDRQRPAAAVAAAQIVQTDHEKTFRINRFAGSDHIVPPACVFILRRMPARNMMVARQRMAD